MDQQVYRVLSCGKSDTGKKRKNNQDAFAIKPEANVCAVADGMGGAAAGEVASRLFTETALDVFTDVACPHEQQAVDLVRKTFAKANQAILHHVERNPQCAGMGATAELLVLCNGRYVVGHVGDSRTYLFRSGVLRQITRDHSLVQDQLDRGIISREEAVRHRYRNVILRAIGASETLAVDLLRGKLVSGDMFLMCSDGLTNMVENSVIEAVLSSTDSLASKVDELIDRANASGGQDNITVVLTQMK